MQFEVEVHKNRIKTLEEHNSVMEQKMEHYIEQQSLFKLMKKDLEKYKKAYVMSLESQTMYSPFTPLNKFKPETFINLKNKDQIIDIKGVFKEENEAMERIKLENDNYKIVCLELRKEIAKMERKIDENDRHFKKQLDRQIEISKGSAAKINQLQAQIFEEEENKSNLKC